jgi:hypothetical protein
MSKKNPEGDEMTPREISRTATRIFNSKLPPRWASRNQEDQEDFGVDWEIEPMLPRDQPSGTIFKVQQKGTRKLDLINGGITISFRDLPTPRAQNGTGLIICSATAPRTSTTSLVERSP